MVYIIIAKDGTDGGAQERRASVRQEHLEKARQLKDAGTLLMGGALLDGEQSMIGSALLVEAENEEEARRIVESDVYTTGGVWVSYEIWPFKQAM